MYDVDDSEWTFSVAIILLLQQISFQNFAIIQDGTAKAISYFTLADQFWYDVDNIN